MPWKLVMAGMAQPGLITVVLVTTPLATRVLAPGLARWLFRQAMGPRPVAWACTTKPTNATCGNKKLSVPTFRREGGFWKGQKS